MPVELQEPAVAWRLPLNRYRDLIDGGLLGEDDRVELIEGVASELRVPSTDGRRPLCRQRESPRCQAPGSVA